MHDGVLVGVFVGVDVGVWVYRKQLKFILNNYNKLQYVGERVGERVGVGVIVGEGECVGVENNVDEVNFKCFLWKLNFHKCKLLV